MPYLDRTIATKPTHTTLPQEKKLMPRLFDYLKTPYPEEFKSLHAAGIQAVSLANWATLQNIAAQLEKSELATCKVRERLKQLKPKTGDRPSDATFQRERLHWARLLQPGYLKWQQHHIAQLNDPRWWQQCFETVKSFSSEKQHVAETTLRELQAKWSVQSAYAHYSTIDLIHVYQSVMPVFAEWLQDAQREWSQHAHRFTPSQQRAYQTYLTEFEAALVEEKQRLRACLQGRITVGIQKGNGTRDNLLDALRDTLKSIGLLAPNPRIEKALAYGHLTPQAFVAIEAIFQQDGIESEKQAFFALPYYSQPIDNSENFDKDTGKTLPLGNHTHLPSRSDVMPAQPPFYRRLPRFLQWLFWDEQVDDQFFERAEHRFLKLQENAFLMSTQQPTLFTLAYESHWQTGQTALNDLITERERVRYWLAHPLAFFFPSTAKRLVDYMESLTQRADAWVARQLRMVMDGMAAKANQPLNEAEKTVLEKAMRGLQAAKTQWRLSPVTLSTLNQFEISYAPIAPLPADASQTLPAESYPALSLRDQFREVIRQTVVRFEATQTMPLPDLDALKTQLAVDPSLYDSVGLRLWLTDYLANTTTLPETLVADLQAILATPQFNGVALDSEEHKTFRQMRQISMAASIPPPPKTCHLWDENPWDYTKEAFTHHWQAIKTHTANLPNGFPLTENTKVCAYTLRFFKQIYALSQWSDFVERRDHIMEGLNGLLEVSQAHTLIQPILIAIIDSLSSIHPQRWNLFREILLMTEIRTLENFINKPISATVNLEAASYTSQREFDFTRRQNQPDRREVLEASPMPSIQA